MVNDHIPISVPMHETIITVHGMMKYECVECGNDVPVYYCGDCVGCEICCLCVEGE